MPTYELVCSLEEGGCGHEFSKFAVFEKRHRIPCPQCGKIKPVQINWGKAKTHLLIPGQTVGTLAEMNAKKLSEEEKEHLKTENRRKP